MSDILIRVEGRAGRITLNRPKALNALTDEMIRAIDAALDAWRDDDNVALVLIDAEGERAFGAGGDIRELYRTGREGDFDFARRFWAFEYGLNAKIARYPKPYVAFMHGFVMGGGVGISALGSHRIVTDSTQVAMPECGIGLIPDVGGTWLLAKAPGRIGEYLGMTGVRIGPADAMHAGFADAYVPEDRLEDLKTRLIKTGDTAEIAQYAAKPPDGELAFFQLPIDDAFSAASPVELESKLDTAARAGLPWATATLQALRHACPLSVSATMEMVREARAMTLEEALAHEYRFTFRCMEQGEFLEGVRAAVIDKDRSPKWAKPALSDVTAADVDAMLAPLGADELKL